MLIRGGMNNASIELSEQESLARRDGLEFYRVTLREMILRRVSAFTPTSLRPAACHSSSLVLLRIGKDGTVGDIGRRSRVSLS